MTLGIDVSRLFPDMIMACNTKDLVIKKMVYLYLCNYAVTNPELTLLVINTLQKDCRDEDPMIRGLALRSFTSLRLKSILEYVVASLKNGLVDNSGYVRAIAVTGVLKVRTWYFYLLPVSPLIDLSLPFLQVFHLSADTIRNSDLVDILYTMIRDREPQVVINAIQVLNEILSAEGGIAINQAMVHYLFGRMREFNEWGQCLIISLIPKYQATNEDEMFGIMNLLDGCLKIAHSGVVLATAKAFISLTKHDRELQKQVFLRLKTPLLTLIAAANSEVAYTILHHIAMIVRQFPGGFDDEYKQFYPKYTEPSSVKSLKIDILPRIANGINAKEIIAELSENVAGIDPELSKHAVRAIGEIAIQVPETAEAVVEALLELVDLDADYVRAETVMVMQEVLRKYPERAPSVVPSLHKCLQKCESTEGGKAAVVWMLGEYGQLIDNAPYLLEPIIDEVDVENSTEVRCELLTAAVKLFIKRPPEMQVMLARLFTSCLRDSVPNLVRDKALFYYRLLRANVSEAAAVIAGSPDGGNGARVHIQDFHDEVAEEVRRAIWDEFNTLSVLYGKPSSEFISPDHLFATSTAMDASPAVQAHAASDSDALLTQQQTGLSPASAAVPHAHPVAAAPATVYEEDLLGLNTAFASTSISAPDAPPSSLLEIGAGATATGPTLSFAPTTSLEPASFQNKWMSLANDQPVRFQGSVPTTPTDIEGTCKTFHIHSIASGDVGTHIRVFAYAQDSRGTYHLYQIELDKGTLVFTVTVKSESFVGSEEHNFAITSLRSALSNIGAF